MENIQAYNKLMTILKSRPKHNSIVDYKDSDLASTAWLALVLVVRKRLRTVGSIVGRPADSTVPIVVAALLGDEPAMPKDS